MKTETRAQGIRAMLTFALLTLATTGAGAVDTTIPFLPDVEGQFASLAVRPEALAFRIGGAPEPTQCKHYQGLARSTGTGTPYLFLSWSGNAPSPDLCGDSSDDPGALLVVRLGTRGTNGERMRSNRLLRGVDIADTIPAAVDANIRTILLNGAGGWPAYGHPGGMQMIGDVLVLALETRYDDTLPENQIVFIDVSDPEDPDIISGVDVGFGPDFSAGLVGLTSVLTETDECCRYVMIVTGKENKQVRLYRSTTTDLALGWEFLTSRSESQIESCLGADWHTGTGDAHQMLNFVRQGSQTGPLYLIGGRNTTPFPSGDDMIDLYRVNMDVYGNPEECLLTHLRSTHVTSHPVVGGGDSANFGAASGTYISPSGELIVYSAEYENDGPSDGERNIVRFGEWRHEDMVRSGSPTLRPTTRVDGPYTVDEGSSVNVTGSGGPATTKAWLQLFEDDNLGASVPPLGNKDDWLVADYEDWNKDDFDDFREEDYSDDAGSWRWFAPVGCTMRANDDDFGDGNFPGQFTRTLHGTGMVEEAPDLDVVTNDDGELSMNDEVTSMQFFSDCDTYYGAAISLAWDLDDNGSFEAQGDTVSFSAFDLDGPATITLRARGEHPTDPTPLGMGEAVATTVSVLNVPPDIGPTRLVDELGLEIGADIPFAVQGLTYFLESSFTDPGRPDTQTASIDWGDGNVDPSSTFDTFSDAFGGGTGQIRQHHAYNQPGNLVIELSVTDDDDGKSAVQLPVEVLDAAGAVAAAAEALQDLLDASGDPEVQDALEQILARLLGNNDGMAANGALDKLDKDQLKAAMAKIVAAMSYLISAEESGVGDLTGEKVILATAARALAYEALANAQAEGKPAAITDMIQAAVDAGDAYLAATDYLAAVMAYQNAVQLDG